MVKLKTLLKDLISTRNVILSDYQQLEIEFNKFKEKEKENIITSLEKIYPLIPLLSSLIEYKGNNLSKEGILLFTYKYFNYYLLEDKTFIAVKDNRRRPNESQLMEDITVDKIIEAQGYEVLKNIYDSISNIFNEAVVPVSNVDTQEVQSTPVNTNVLEEQSNENPTVDGATQSKDNESTVDIKETINSTNSQPDHVAYENQSRHSQRNQETRDRFNRNNDNSRGRFNKNTESTDVDKRHNNERSNDRNNDRNSDRNKDRNQQNRNQQNRNQQNSGKTNYQNKDNEENKVKPIPQEDSKEKVDPLKVAEELNKKEEKETNANISQEIEVVESHSTVVLVPEENDSDNVIKSEENTSLKETKDNGSTNDVEVIDLDNLDLNLNDLEEDSTPKPENENKNKKDSNFELPTLMTAKKNDNYSFNLEDLDLNFLDDEQKNPQKILEDISNLTLYNKSDSQGSLFDEEELKSSTTSVIDLTEDTVDEDDTPTTIESDDDAPVLEDEHPTVVQVDEFEDTDNFSNDDFNPNLYDGANELEDVDINTEEDDFDEPVTVEEIEEDDDFKL